MADLTRLQFADELLAQLGDPITPQNEKGLLAWEAAEGGNWNNSARYNPLNTTQREPGSYSINGVGVQAYTSWDQGLAATVTTLDNGYYGPILDALHAGTSAEDLGLAVAASPWGTGNGVINVLNRGGRPVPTGGKVGPLPSPGSLIGKAAGAIGGAVASPFEKAAGHIAILAVGLLAGGALVVAGLIKATGAGKAAKSVVSNLPPVIPV